MDDHFIKGLEHAAQVLRKDPTSGPYWLDRARNGRRKLWTRLFRPAKRQFLGGFIAGLEWELAQSDSDGDLPGEPPAESPSSSEAAGA